MILWIIIGIVILSFVGLVIYVKWGGDYYFSNVPSWVMPVSLICFIVSGIVLIMLILGLITEYSQARFKKVEYQQRYETLIYQAETLCKDDFGLTNRDVIKDIEYWNIELASNKKKSHDFWIGILHPNIYDDFDFIDLNSIVYNNTAGGEQSPSSFSCRFALGRHETIFVK